MASPEDHVRALQANIRERLDALRPLVPDTEGYARVAAQVLEATAELIEYEERLPLLIDEPRHRLSVAVVRWSGVATTAVAGVLALACIPGWVATWWLALLLPVAFVGLGMLRLPVHPPGGPHVEQRNGAAVVGSSSPLTALAVSGLVTEWVAIASVLLVVGGVAYIVRRTATPGPGGGRDRAVDPDAPTPPTGLVMPP
jgi:hypothetical protein